MDSRLNKIMFRHKHLLLTFQLIKYIFDQNTDEWNKIYNMFVYWYKSNSHKIV